ncbi:MAG: rhomboid family intramembrane serine protease [Waddliaceae bacterium]
MTYTTSHFRLGPEFTPGPIKKLILCISLIGIVSALVNNLFLYWFRIPGPQEWFSLSWWGIEHYLLWQPITCLFVQYTGYQGITLWFLLALAFNLYILWVMGSDVFHRVGRTSFLQFYFICGILAGLGALFLMPLTGQYGILSGATPSVFAILVVWTFMNPETELLLFFLIPIKAKWLTLGILGAILLVTLSQLNIVHFTYFFFGGLIGYLYGLIAWDLHSPFPFLYRFEWSVIRFSEKMRQRFVRLAPSRKPSKKRKKESKRFTIQPEDDTLDDDRFIDTMLEKISKQGEQSLTWKERERMQKISELKRQEKRK